MIGDGKDVVLFTKQGCGDCDAARTRLAHLGVPYIEYDISRDEGGTRMLLALIGRAVVPTITIAGDVMVGFDPERLDQLLDFGKRATPDHPYDIY